ncbi:MAG: preprotein translocase subunit SecG [Nitrospirae bacterium]|nr:preprotein translocase subunit SecG [Nitrospirota bacterium]MBI5696383.1 preprotein translocase subunit SecG [Nitrospirota bacterium]
MATLLLIIHLVVSATLLIAILLQTGKGAEMGANFGGGASTTIFGSRGSGNFLTKLTAAAATVFMLTSLGLSLVSSGGISSSVVRDVPAKSEAPAESGAPAAPAQNAPFVPAQGGAPAGAPAAPAMPPAQGGK